MADFSSNVTIQISALVKQLTLSNSTVNRGSFGPAPPNTIASGTSISFRLHDPSGPSGSDGAVTYSSKDVQLVVTFACPYWSSNEGSVLLTGSDKFVADWWAGAPNNWSLSSVPPGGHPLQMSVYIRATSEPFSPPPWA